MSNHTFGVVSADPLGIATEDFILVGTSPVVSLGVAIAEDGLGEFVAASQKTYGAKKAISNSYKSVSIGAIAAIEAAVGEAAEVAVETISISTAKGAHATGSASGHSHIGGTNSDHNDSERTVTVPSFAGFGASDFGLVGLLVPAASLQSATYTIEIGHTDADNNVGNFLAGQCHGEKHTATFEAIDETDWGIPAGWVAAENMPTGESIEGNKQFHSRRLTIVKHVGYAPAVPDPEP